MALNAIIDAQQDRNALRSAPLGLYVHVPFCSHACDFCAFYQEAPHRDELDRYLSAMEAEFRLFQPERPIDTIFWGGGTPGLLPARDLERLGVAMRSCVNSPPVEWTVEMAPSTVKPDKLSVLKDLGVSRISLGVQSFDDTILEALGRRHSAAQVSKAIDMIHAAGFMAMNLDLIFAIPGQRLNAWHDDLLRAIAMQPSHISTYCLTFEDDTRLLLKLQQGKIKRFTSDEEKQFYDLSIDILDDSGFPQYEISNFAKPGFRCRHNVNTWRMHEWVGFGPSAASQYQRRRFANPSSIETWADAVIAGTPLHVDASHLDDQTLAIDALIFGLRMNDGVHLGEIKERFPLSALEPMLAPTIEDWVAERLAVRIDDKLCLTRSGRMIADGIAVQILEAC